MISRIRREAVLVALLAGAAFLTLACQKVPLLAPSGSTITLTAAATALPANGSTEIIAQVIEPAGTPPQRGTLITFTTNLGSVQPSSAETDISGRVIVKYVAGGGSGTATITAISGGVSASGTNAIKIAVGAAAVGGLSVSASPQTLPATGGSSTISATVIDASGNSVSGVPVTFSIDTSTGSSGAGSLSATIANSDPTGRAQTTLTTNRTTTVTATAGIATTTGTATTAAQSGKVTVTVNTTSSIAIGAPNPSSPTVGQSVTFTLTAGTSTTASTISRVSVDWGDGQTQSYTGLPAAISHAYRSAGSYLVVVTGIDGLGDTSTSTASVTVVQQPRPVVTISSSTTNPQPNQAVTFTIGASAAAGSNATIQSITIDFGDGSQQTLQGNATSVQHVYNSAGTYTVTAVATDSAGTSGSASTVIVVGNVAASFTISPKPTRVGQTTSFNGSDSTSASPITTYTFDFGDGTPPGSGSSPQQTHVYAATGVFTTRLTIQDSAGRTATKTQDLTVNP